MYLDYHGLNSLLFVSHYQSSLPISYTVIIRFKTVLIQYNTINNLSHTVYTISISIYYTLF